MNQDLLKTRVEKFISELNLPISRFAKSIGFDRTAYYKWMKGVYNFSAETLQKIENHISKFGY